MESDEQTVAHVMNWLLEKLHLKVTLQHMFSMLARSPDDLGVTVWHAGACSTARILSFTSQYTAQVLKVTAASVSAALAVNGMLSALLFGFHFFGFCFLRISAAACKDSITVQCDNS